MNKHNFTPFTESLPEQGRWILVTDDIKNVKRYLWLSNLYWKHGESFYVFGKDGYTKIYGLSHWKYAIKEGG